MPNCLIRDVTTVEGHFNPGLFNPKLQPQTFQPHNYEIFVEIAVHLPNFLRTPTNDSSKTLLCVLIGNPEEG